jgi:uncharacterized protein (DUF1697 family)
MTTVIALLRAVNVGRRRVPMADLRTVVEAQGHQRVRTLLNSGNVVFDTALPSTAEVAARLQPALEVRFGIPMPLTVLDAAQLRRLIDEHPWAGHEGHYASRQLVAFPAHADALARARPLGEHNWGDEAFVLGEQAAWLWCPEGIARSPLALAFARATGDGFTARNWSTVLKLHSLTQRRA